MKPVVYFRCLSLVALIGVLSTACQRLQEEDEPALNEKSTLQVKARATGNSEIVYPLYLYAFDGEGICQASQILDDAEEAMQLFLSNGTYRIVAVAGVSEEYTLPNTPTLASTIELTGTCGATCPMMIGKADVEVKGSTEIEADITLSYVVSAINVALKNVPDDITSVQLCLSPLYSTLTFGGEYGGESQTIRLDCSLDSEDIWGTSTCYVFPGKGTETVFSIILTKDDGTETTYGYTYQGIPLANHPFNVSGNYAGGVTVAGSFITKDWEQPIEVLFDFGTEEVESPEEEEEESPSTDTSDVPEVGSIWNGAIVTDIVTTDDGGTTLLLMSLDEWTATTSQVEEVIGTYESGGISEWRLPTYDEAKTLRSTFGDGSLSTLNELIAAYDENLTAIDEEERYLCDKDGTYYSFIFATGTTLSKAGTKRSYLVRLVTEYVLDEE